MRQIDEYYTTKIESDDTDDKEENERSQPHEYFIDYLLFKQGLKSMADKKALEIIASVGA